MDTYHTLILNILIIYVFYDYALAPEKLEINHDMLSKYCSNIAKKYSIECGGVNILVPNLGNKIKNVFHYKNIRCTCH